MSNSTFDLLAALVLVAVFGGLVAIAGMAGCDAGYEDGQIDAANGKFYYRLVDESDGTKRWRKFEQPTTQPK